MLPVERPGTLRATRPPLGLGVTASVLSVAAATGAIYPLKGIAPAVSLSVVYLPAVLLVSAYWGLALGLVTSLLSAGAFNFFHLPPVGRFTIADGRNWSALGAFMLVALVVSTMAELARSRALEADRRRAEADLAAALRVSCWPGSATAGALAGAARRVAGSARAELGVDRARRERGDDRRRALALSGADGGPDRDAARAARADRRCRATAADVRGAGARGGGGDRAAPGRAASRGGRDRCPPTLRRRQDRGAPRGIARPAHAGDRDRGRRACAGHRLAHRRGAHRAERRGGPGRRAAGRPGRQAARPLPSPGRPGRAAPRHWISLEDVVLAARDGLPVVGGGGVGSESRGEVRISIDPDVPPVRADAAHLERAFANLLENALRYSGGLPVSVHVRRSGSGVVARVVDRGPASARPSGPGSSSRFTAARRRPRGRGAARGWVSRSPRGSSRPTAARSRSTRSPARDRALWSRSRSSRLTWPTTSPSRQPCSRRE